MSRLLLPFADQHVEIPSLTAGNIALTVGLKQVSDHMGSIANHVNVIYKVYISKNFTNHLNVIIWNMMA